jgi:HD-GYP domain-containing protein (c-di-GMP phosphodiesterase class II)
VSIVDVYDTLRSKRPYRPALSHEAAMHLIVDESPGQFDPVLVELFRQCAPEFRQIFSDLPDSAS